MPASTKLFYVARAIAAGAFGRQPGVNKIAEAMTVRKHLVIDALNALKDKGITDKVNEQWTLLRQAELKQPEGEAA